ncbi:MAG: glycogen debranching enzyme family protein [Phycisphaeraceae bacterium]|nr:glycogen debranching enzyme family protein [Phycisphaeraceae bacterium]
MTIQIDERTEWLEADGLGGFASGTTSGVRSRRYHGLLTASVRPPTGRFVLVNGFDAWIETPGGVFPLTSQKYPPGVVHPHGSLHIASFTHKPWPTWTCRFEDGTELVHEVFVPRGRAMVAVSFRLVRGGAGGSRLVLRPFLSGRDYHSLHHENGEFNFTPEVKGEVAVFRPYPGVPSVVVRSNGVFASDPVWYRNFQYDEERARGLECTEDLASPGSLTWRLSARDGAEPAVMLLAAGSVPCSSAELISGPSPAVPTYEDLRNGELHRRRALGSGLEVAANSYISRREDPGSEAGRTIIAGYPWFTDWGRDTFISLRGLCLAAGRIEDARAILLAWAAHVSEGMLPNRFPDSPSDSPEYNAVDASLWYVVAVGEYLDLAAAGKASISASEERTLRRAVLEIVSGYSKGTRYGIRVDRDGLVAAGEPGVQLTWMDAKCGDWVVTPRIGKPVEIQALWAAALAVAERFDSAWSDALQRVRTGFAERFWNPERGCLFDVVDTDHVTGRNDGTLRPNQLFAVGGLPVQLVAGDQARQIVDLAERELLTPMGPRSLARGEPGYTERYGGTPLQRDGSYHQGIVWPWVLGAFVEAWVRVRGGTDEAKSEARRRFLDPILAGLDDGSVGGLGHIAEIADAAAPFTPRGCPFQAWSIGEALRLDRVVLAPGHSQSTGIEPRPVTAAPRGRAAVGAKPSSARARR